MTNQIGNLGEAMIEQMSPSERYESMPRPLRYVRPRLYPDGAEWLHDLLEDERVELLRELADLRGKGRPESDPDIQECRAALGHAVQIIRDISLGQVELVGPQKTEG